MIRWLDQFRHVTRNAFVVLLADPFMLILNLFVLGAVLLLACLPGFTFGDQVRLLRDQCLALTFLCGCCGATLGAARLIADDIRRGMAPVVMSRPVAQSAFVFGKCAGLVGGLAGVWTSATTAYLWGTRLIHHPEFLERTGLVVYLATLLLTMAALAVKHYLFRGAFVWKANLALTGTFLAVFLVFTVAAPRLQAVASPPPVDWAAIPAFVCLFMALGVFAAAMTAGAVLFDQAVLIVTAALLFVVGLFAQFFLSALPVPEIQSALQVLLPDWQRYYITETIAQNVRVPVGFLVSSLVHALGQAILLLCVGTALLERSEIRGTL